MKIALFTGNYNHIRDGVSLTLNRLVEFLLRSGHQVRIYAPSTDSPAIKHHGELYLVPSITIPGRSEYKLTYSFPRKAKQDCAAFNPDIIHIATPDRLGYLAMRWGKKKKIPVVSSYHTNFLSYISYYSIIKPFYGYLRWYIKMFYRNCEQIYVPSVSMAEDLHDQIDLSKVQLWERGVELDRFNPSYRSMHWRRKWGFKDNEIIITFVSRLVLEKDVDIYAKVVQKLTERYLGQVRGLIVGSGPAEENMKKWLPNQIFTGSLSGEELSIAYASSDLFLFPSISETFGNVTLEALASGVPCFVADAPGSRSLVQEKTNGCIAEPKNVDDFVQKMTPFIESKALREQFSLNARETAEHYSWDEINTKLLGYYQKLLNA